MLQPMSFTYYHPREITYNYTIDVERFAGLTVHSFNHSKVFVEILSRCLGQKCLSFSIIIKRGAYIYRKTFMILLKTVKNAKV